MLRYVTCAARTFRPILLRFAQTSCCRKLWQMAFPSLSNFPLLPPLLATSLTIRPHTSFQLSSWCRNSPPLIELPNRGKNIQTPYSSLSFDALERRNFIHSVPFSSVSIFFSKAFAKSYFIDNQITFSLMAFTLNPPSQLILDVSVCHSLCAFPFSAVNSSAQYLPKGREKWTCICSFFCRKL